MIYPEKRIVLVESAFLNVIRVAGTTGNLALTTYVTVNTKDNSTEVRYYVRSWNDRHKRLERKFNIYSEAFDYYNKLSDKFGTK